MTVEKIISGGQTGVDRAALDVAIELGIPHGGFVPLGRIAEDGVVPAKYQLTEMWTRDYPARTRANVEAADGTLIIVAGFSPKSFLAGGSALTAKECERLGKPYRCAALLERVCHTPKDVREWVEDNKIKTLNVAGLRESKHPGIGEMAMRFLREVLAS